jgi:outer membrane protein assembly factor BamB
MATHATLYALDAATGEELYSSGNMASTFAHSGGLAVANKRVYFTTHDNTVFALGFLADQPQLTGK